MRFNDIPEIDEILKAINFLKEELYEMWKEMGKENWELNYYLSGFLFLPT